MDILSLDLIVIFGLIFLISLVSAPIKDRLPTSEPLLALLVGALLNVGAFHPLSISGQTVSRAFVHTFAEITLAIALMTTALQVPRGYLRRNWRPVLVLLGLGLPLMWMVSSALVYFALGLPLAIAAFVGAAITPTDPVLASTIVSGDLAENNIPRRLRHLITVESGINDGLGYPFALLPLALLAHPPRAAITTWLVHTVLWEVGGAILFGVILGIVAGLLANWSFAHRATMHSSFLGLTLALSLVSLGALQFIGTDAILGVFAAGLAFNEVLGYRGHEIERAEHVQEAVERFFDLPVFIVLGALVPWGAWVAMGWRAVLLVLVVLLLRRMPAVLLLRPLLGRSVERVSDALFAGWFGPIGISALFYATLALPSSQTAAVWGPITLLVVASIVAHGMSATNLTMLYGRHLDTIARSTREVGGDTVQERTEHIAQHVRESVRDTSERDIERIISDHLSHYRQDALEHHRRDRLDRIGRLVSSRVPAQDVGGSSEGIEAVSRAIAGDVAQHLAETAAGDVVEQVSRNIRENNDDARGDGN